MIELSVGQVSGAIALATSVLQVLIPMAIVAALVGFLRDENTASTWSVSGRLVQNSYWPLILRSETVTGRHVSKRVEFFRYLAPVSLVLVAIAGIVTPLGLYDAFESGPLTNMPFIYVRDDSLIGVGTPPRINLQPYRACGQECAVDYDDISQPLYDLYSSGSTGKGTSVSSIFDIQWRHHTAEQKKRINNGPQYLVGYYSQVESLILKEGHFHLIEGLVVDMRDFGVGLRNHTIPSKVQHETIWAEDILFVEPETQCASSNLSIDFTVGHKSYIDRRAANVTLTDRGGFSKLVQEYPDSHSPNRQDDPALKDRAYALAWYFSFLTGAFMNVTTTDFSYLTSKLGDEYNLEGGKALSTLQSVQSKQIYDLMDQFVNYKNLGNYSIATIWNFTLARNRCVGLDPHDRGNISNIAITCGIVFGAAQRIDGETSTIFYENSRWSMPIYNCATAVKAIVKKVTFSARGPALHDVKVLNISEKQYNNESPPPVWGVESTVLQMEDASALWGLLSPSYKDQNTANFSTIQRPHLYLPVVPNGVETSVLRTKDNLPGAHVFALGLDMAYSIDHGGAHYLTDSTVYGGRKNVALFSRWQELSKNAQSTARIINSVWTDTVANAIVGSKSILGGPFTEHGKGRPSTDSTEVIVTPIVKRVKFKIVYGIPAFIVLLLWLITAVSAAGLFLMKRVTLDRIQHCLRCSSAGRLLATAVHPELSNLQIPSSDWTREAGGAIVSVSDKYPAEISVGKDSEDAGDESSLRSEASHGLLRNETRL